MLKRSLLFSLLTFILLSAPASATVFELEDGTTVEGEIITQEGDQYYIETPGGLINLTSMEIYKIDGKLHQIEGLVSEEAIAEEKQKQEIAQQQKSQRRYAPRYKIPVPATSTLAARVEKGGITHAEFKSYLAEVAQVAGQTLDQMTENSRKEVLDQAIEHEMLLEGALRENIHTKKIMRDRILGLYLSEKVKSKRNSSSVSELDLRSFHREHSDLFRKDPLILYSSHDIPDPWNSSAYQRKNYLKKIKRDPTQVKAWASSGWIRPHRECVASGPGVQLYCDEIFKMKKGDIALYESVWANVIIWMKDRKGNERIPYEKLKPRQIVDEMIKKDQQAAYHKLLEELNTTDEDVLFETALKEGYHRKLPIRQNLIFRYIAKRQTSYEKAIDELRPRADFEILIKDIMAISGESKGERFISKYWHPNSLKFLPETGEIKDSQLLPVHGEEKFWAGVWAPSGELLFNAPAKAAPTTPVVSPEKVAVKKLSKSEQKKLEERSLTPLREEVDQVSALQAQHEKLQKKLEKQPTKIKNTMIFVYIVGAIIFIGLIVWVLSRF